MSGARRGVYRLSQIWIPNAWTAYNQNTEDAFAKLLRAGFFMQSHVGIFHLLPLGLRVQDKIEALISKHMEESLGASRVSLSTISSEKLWEKSGRLEAIAPELFRFQDRAKKRLLLAPTHEEEITTLVSHKVRSSKALPLRLYQITRKYRDEARPRHGLLRSREFVMKDLYTFDATLTGALKTYEDVQAAYRSIFSAMKLPVLVAKASSGDMGGDLSHEYHLPIPIGEDDVVSCDQCDYVINEQLAETAKMKECQPEAPVGVWRGISRDRSTLINAWYPSMGTNETGDDKTVEVKAAHLNIHAIKERIGDFDAVDGGDFSSCSVKKLIDFVDTRLGPSFSARLTGDKPKLPVLPEAIASEHPALLASLDRESGKPFKLLRVRQGDGCPKCPTGFLRVQKAMELGHTFHLGTRYSNPLQAGVQLSPATAAEAEKEQDQRSRVVTIEMGCHGIGVTRIMGAVAHFMADANGLNWPAIIAPFSCVVQPAHSEADLEAALEVANYLQCEFAAQWQTPKLDFAEREDDWPWVDLAVDDRSSKAHVLKRRRKEMRLIGVPLDIIVGRAWRRNKQVEVECPRLGVSQLTSLKDAIKFIRSLLEQL